MDIKKEYTMKLTSEEMHDLISLLVVARQSLSKDNDVVNESKARQYIDMLGEGI